MVRDPIGQTIAARLDLLEAPDDRTLVWRLNKPFASLPYALAKTQPSPVIMPARLAATDPYRQVSEIVGSGPFRWVAEEYLPGNRAVFAKSDRYRPRDEPASHCAGGHRVLVDRVEWQFIPDAATAANALINGEVDWIDQPLPDLLPRLRRARGVTVGVIDSYGTFGAIRPNHLHGPTANAGVRRALMAAIDQVEVMTAAMGEDRSLFRAPVGFFLPGTPAANDAGMEVVRQRPGKDRVKAMLAEAGYAGERIVCMHPTDQSFYDAFTSVCVAAWREVGVNVDDQSMDWGTVVQRRTSREPLDKGGWSVFLRLSGGGVPRPGLRHQPAGQRQGRLVRLAGGSRDRGDARRLDGQHRRAGDAPAGSGDPAPRLPAGALHPARPVFAACRLAEQPARHAEGPGAGVLEHREGLTGRRMERGLGWH
ncbi:ABC transporter substrate-binding protein [Siccirubricoccus deserti]